MKKTLFTSLLLIITFALSAKNAYLIEDLGTFALFDQSEVIDLNEKGEVLFKAAKMHRGHVLTEQTFLRTQERGIVCLDQPVSCQFTLVNNRGSCLSTDGEILLWQKDGTCSLLPLEKTEKGFYQAADLNDADQVLVNFYEDSIATKNYLWEKGNCVELPIARQLELLGFYPRNVEMLGINNRGQMVGIFWHGTYHRYKPDKWIWLGCKAFRWDGMLHIIDLPTNHLRGSIKLCEEGSVLFSSYTQDPIYSTFLWNPEKGLFYQGPFQVLAAVSERKILGLYRHGHYVFCLDGRLWNFTDLLTLPPFGEEKLEPLDRWSCYTDLTKINGLGQVVGNGWYYGEPHGFLLQPCARLSEEKEQTFSTVN